MGTDTPHAVPFAGLAGPAPTASGSPGTGHDGLGLAAALGPQLREVCDGRLGEIEWFRSTWQRGGASTGFSTWTFANDRQIEVMVKVPVGPAEHSWTLRLGAVDHEEWDSPGARQMPTPRVVAAGEALGGHDLAWLVVERLKGRTVGSHLTETALMDLVGAAADFQARALAVSNPHRFQTTTDWVKVIHRARELAPDCGLSEPQRWKEALKRVERVLPQLVDRWEHRDCSSWCHGDLHPGNALYRVFEDGSKFCVLIDLGLIHAGHWVEDGVYLERQFWGHSELLCGVKPVAALAKARRQRGLPVVDGYADLANIRRVLMAACVPVQLAREGNQKYVHAALETLERLLPQVSR